jgi:hypothetical protein
MDKAYAEELIKRLESAKALHALKFAGKSTHANCLERFDETIARLRSELNQTAEHPKVNIAARGDELLASAEVNRLSNLLEASNHHEKAERMRQQARSMAAHVLNDMDGFDR